MKAFSQHLALGNLWEPLKKLASDRRTDKHTVIGQLQSTCSTFSVKAFIHQPGMYDIEIKKGHTFRYDIWFGGEPPPTVTWEREGAQVQADQRITIELFSKKTVYCERNTVLTVKKVGAVN